MPRTDRQCSWPPDVYPDRKAPIILHGDGDLEIARPRWGRSSPPQFRSMGGRNNGVTNVRNATSLHRRRWLGGEHRGLLPFKRFSEPGAGWKTVWFAPVDDSPHLTPGGGREPPQSDAGDILRTIDEW